MKSLFQALPIRRRLTVLLIIPMFLLSALIVAYFPSVTARIAMEGLERKAMSLTLLVADSVAVPLDLGDSESMQPVLDTAGKDEDILFGVVITPDGRRFAGFQRHNHALAENWPLPSSKGLVLQGASLETHMPVHKDGKVIGAVIAGFSTKRITDQIAHERYISLFIGAGILITMILVGAIIGTMIAAPIESVIQSLSAGANRLGLIASDLATSGQEVAAGAGTQAQNLEEAAATLEELSAATRHNSDHAASASEKTQQSKVAVGDCVSAMEDMSAAVQRISDTSSRTTPILTTIDEIAFQTNLLALNAAIEAAHAGEHGRGFAIVADEVRDLSRRSATAARETAALIEESRLNATEGVKATTKANAILRHLASETGQLATIINEVANATRDQSRGLDQMTMSVTDLSRITQHNVGASENAAATAHELRDHAGRIQSLVSTLTGIVHGNGSRGST